MSVEKILVATMGLPYSGKSRWARTQGCPIVSPDEIRLALHGQRYVVEAEPFVWAIARVMVTALFASGHDRVILDACNVTMKRRDEWLDKKKWNLRFYDLHRGETPDVELSLHRAGRAQDTYIIPIIKRMAIQWEPLQEGEWVWGVDYRLYDQEPT